MELIDKIKNAVNNSNRPVIIFPQATRVLPNEKIPFGVALAPSFLFFFVPDLPIEHLNL